VDEKMPSAKTECKTNVKKARGPTRQQKKEDTIELDDSSSSSGTSKEGSEGSEDDPLCCYDLMIYDKNQECMDDDDFEPFDCPGDKTELVKCRGPRCDEYFHPCCLNYVKKLWPKTIDGFCVICNKGLPGAIVCDIPQCIVKYNPDKPFHYCQTKGCFNTFHEQCYDDCHKGSRSGLGSDYEFCLDCEQKKLPKESNARSPEKNDQTSEQDDIKPSWAPALKAKVTPMTSHVKTIPQTVSTLSFKQRFRARGHFGVTLVSTPKANAGVSRS